MAESQYPNNDDISLVRDYIELPFVLDVIESNIKVIEDNFRVPDVFKTHLTTIQNQINLELKEIRLNMRRRGIKILEEHRLKDRVSVSYLCRGYTRSFSLLYGLLKSRIETRIANILKIDIGKIIRD